MYLSSFFKSHQFKVTVSFFVGVLFFFEIRFNELFHFMHIGDGIIYFGELAFILLLLFSNSQSLIITIGGNKYIQIYLYGWILYLFSLVITDIYQQTNFLNFLKGFVRASLLLSNVLGFYLVLIFNDRKIKNAFFIGMILSLWVMYFYSGGFEILGWKYGLAFPFTITLLIGAKKLNLNKKLLIVAILSALNLLLDYRLFSIILFLIFALVLTFNIRQLTFITRISKSVLLIGVCSILVFIYISNYGIDLDTTITNSDVQNHRESSNAWRIAGIKTGIQLINKFNLVGYGSFSNDSSIVILWAKNVSNSDDPEKYMNIVRSYYSRYPVSSGNVFTAIHSQLLRAGVEYGISAMLYFAIQIFLILKCIKVLFVKQNNIDTFTLFLSLFAIFSILFSTFSNPLKIIVQIPIAISFYILNFRNKII